MFDMDRQIDALMPTELVGHVARTVGTTISVAGFPAPVGAVAEIERHAGAAVKAEVIGFRDDMTELYPLSDVSGVRRGTRVRLSRTKPLLRVGPELLGRVVDAFGKVIDGHPQPAPRGRSMLDADPPPPVERPRIDAPLATGIRAIDGLLTCGLGQRMGIFSGSGVGKSVLLGMMARYTQADVNVIAMIGERGREVREFIEGDLGTEGLARSVIVVATSDQPAIVRTRAAFAATAIAEYFRDQKKDVLLLVDSLTRFAQAQREIGLAAGEPPTTRGFPPSVFALLPKLVERAGRSPAGSITAFYSVLVEGDDPNEPISDAVRGLIDGHTWLSRKLAGRGHYPAIDLLESISRLMPDVTERRHYDAALAIRELIAAYRDHEDLISIGAYRQGSNPTVDLAIAVMDDTHAYLRQGTDEPANLDDARTQLFNLIAQFAQRRQTMQNAAPATAPAVSTT